MKRLFITIFFVLPLSVFCSELTVSDTNDSSTRNATTIFQLDFSLSQEVSDTVKKERAVTNGLLYSGVSMSIVGTAILVTSIVMGAIPYEAFPDSMKLEGTLASGHSYMFAWICAGASLFCTATAFLLFGLPILIYSIVRKLSESERELNVENKSFSFDGRVFSFKF